MKTRIARIDANGKKLTEDDGTDGMDGTDVRCLCRCHTALPESAVAEVFTIMSSLSDKMEIDYQIFRFSDSQIGHQGVESDSWLSFRWSGNAEGKLTI